MMFFSATIALIKQCAKTARISSGSTRTQTSAWMAPVKSVTATGVLLRAPQSAMSVSLDLSSTTTCALVLRALLASFLTRPPPNAKISLAKSMGVRTAIKAASLAVISAIQIISTRLGPKDASMIKPVASKAALTALTTLRNVSRAHLAYGTIQP